ncbi:hypothetical protein Cgig2_033568 [Carnegiea gigantea]|uniref:Reverse transcriptase zinc-binding domain-containing protein n=1 Tax=Carnegiea gigantea TaxID=171969 RepID=A0A9Q1QM94_9CARY|nr:hypothetical protein Cgig2_033568 [Carnegiea gigantea]
MGWDWDQLVLFLLHAISQRITSFLMMEVGDNLMWAAGKLGIFSIKSALAIISGEHSAKEDRDWKRIWRIKASQRVRTFAWLIIHGKLFTNAERTRRRIINDPYVDTEDIGHILRCCPNALEVSQALRMCGLVVNMGSQDFHKWLEDNVKGRHEDPFWPTNLLIANQYIRQWTCLYYFNGGEGLPWDKGVFLLPKSDEARRVIQSEKFCEGWQAHRQDQLSMCAALAFSQLSKENSLARQITGIS